MKPPVLLLHGALGSAEQMKPLALLLEDYFTVYNLDLPGHGSRAGVGEYFAIDLFAKDVLEFLHQHMLERINVFGYSMGGYIALYLAHYFPESVGKIYTFATKFDWNIETAEKETQFLIPDKIERKVPAFAALLAQRHGSRHWKTVVQNTASLMQEMGLHPPLSSVHFGQIPHDVVLTIGGLDKMVTQSETEKVALELIHGKMMVWEYMPHPFEQADLPLIREQLISFWQDHTIGKRNT